jgi:hypothetical protein
MNTRTMKVVALGLAALAFELAWMPTSTWAQGGTRRQGRNVDRDQAPLAGRIAKGTVQGFSFGSNETATITVKTEDGETLVLNWINAKFHCDRAEATPSSFATKNPTGSPITILFAQAQGKTSLREAWDLASWNDALSKHKGIQTGAVLQLTNRVVVMTNHRYALTKDTIFVKAGKTATREDFKSRDTVFIKGDTSSGVPVALTVADTQEGASSTGLDRAKEEVGGGITPRAQGGNNRPASTGTGNAYSVRIFLKITDSADNERGETPAGQLGELASRFGVEDNKVECFGELRANGMRVWEILKSEARDNQRKAGETLTLLPSEQSGMRDGSRWRVRSETLALTGSLYDDDLATSADLLYSWSLNLNLAELAGQGEKIYKSTTSKAELHVVVTR